MLGLLEIVPSYLDVRKEAIRIYVLFRLVLNSGSKDDKRANPAFFG